MDSDFRLTTSASASKAKAKSFAMNTETCRTRAMWMLGELAVLLGLFDDDITIDDALVTAAAVTTPQTSNTSKRMNARAHAQARPTLLDYSSSSTPSFRLEQIAIHDKYARAVWSATTPDLLLEIECTDTFVFDCTNSQHHSVFCNDKTMMGVEILAKAPTIFITHQFSSCQIQPCRRRPAGGGAATSCRAQPTAVSKNDITDGGYFI